MARMSIDDKVCRDPRITVLAELLGWSRRETVGCLILEVWPICYDQATHLISERILDAAAGHLGFALKLIESELATRDRSGKIRIGGAKERIAYLDHQKRAGRQGGIKSAESRTKEVKRTSSTPGSNPQAVGNPNTNTNTPVPSSASAPDPVQDPEKNSAAPSAGGSRSRKSKPSDPTPDELASVRVVLDKLGKHTDTRYSGARPHVQLITSRLRDGLTETDLRSVVYYCAHPTGLGWTSKPEMAKYLRPETLFGPQSIARYLDAARSWALKQFGPEPAGVAV